MGGVGLRTIIGNVEAFVIIFMMAMNTLSLHDCELLLCSVPMLGLGQYWTIYTCNITYVLCSLTRGKVHPLVCSCYSGAYAQWQFEQYIGDS